MLLQSYIVPASSEVNLKCRRWRRSLKPLFSFLRYTYKKPTKMLEWLKRGWNRNLKGKGLLRSQKLAWQEVSVQCLMCRQLWVEEKKVFSDRMEECQSHQQALTGQLDGANKKSKRVWFLFVWCLWCNLHANIQVLNHYRKRVQKLQQSVEVLKAKEEEVKIEKEAVK